MSRSSNTTDAAEWISPCDCEPPEGRVVLAWLPSDVEMPLRRCGTKWKYPDSDEEIWTEPLFWKEMPLERIK